MDSDTKQPVKPRPYQPFLPLFFSLAGWTLLHAWTQLIGANFRAHVLVACIGSVLTLWSAFPYLSARQRSAEKKDSLPGESRRAGIAGALLLFALGAALGGLIVHGSVFLLALGAMALHFVPWSRVRLSQRDPVLACAAAGCGLAAVLLAGYQSIALMFLPLAAWAFWVCSCVGLILRANNARRAERDAKAKSAARERDSRPSACET